MAVIIAPTSVPPLAKAWILKKASFLLRIPIMGLETVVGGGKTNHFFSLHS